MYTNRKLANPQQTRIQRHSQQSTLHTFFNLLTSPELLSVVEELLPVNRERSFPPTETVSMFLAQAMNADRCCQNIVNEAALTPAFYGMAPCSTNTDSYCKARQRLPRSMISELVRDTGKQLTQQVQTAWSWNGRPVRQVGGATVKLPDTEDNCRIYPQSRNGKGCPLSRIVSIICLSSGGLARNLSMKKLKAVPFGTHLFLSAVTQAWHPERM